MSRATSALFKAACRGLWGEQYQSEAARALGISRSSVLRYADGRRPVPAKVIERLAALLVERESELAKLIPKVVSS
jgi:transcriptional regulator with XRE-family HTH domain